MLLKYVSKRLLQLVPTLLLMATLVFVVLYLLPSDPVEVMLLGQGALAGPEEVEAIREELGLNDPLHVQYGRFLLGAVKGDLGQSIRKSRSVTSIILEQFPNTLRLSGAGMAIALVGGLILGSTAAIWRHSWLDSIVMVASVTFVSTPIFWMGLMLILVFSFALGWFPPTGTGGWKGLVLPALTLGLTSAGMIARLTRSGLVEVMSQDYVRTARAKGLQEWLVIYRHALKNALIPIITVAGLQFGAMLGGAVVTETVFSRPGIGGLTVSAVMWNDFPLIQGLVVFSATFYSLANLLADVLYAWADPRIGYE